RSIERRCGQSVPYREFEFQNVLQGGTAPGILPAPSRGSLMSQTPRTSLSPVAPQESAFDRAQAERDLASIRVPLEEATTLPGRYYHDPVILREEQSRIFAKMWLCVGRESDLAHAGDYVTRAVGSESVVVVRDADGRLNAFFNVCRHRGSRLIEEP